MTLKVNRDHWLWQGWTDYITFSLPLCLVRLRRH